MSGKLKEVRERITSVKSTQQITKAMKMVSAAKLRKAQQAITQLRPYSDRLDRILKNILANLDDNTINSYGVARNVKKAMVIVITSNRGLAGAFNSNIIKEAIQKINELREVRKNKNLTILCVGKKGYDYFKKRYHDCTIVDEFVGIFENLDFDNLAQVAQYAMEGFDSEDYDQVFVAYGRFKNAGMQFPELVQFLPVEISETKGKKSGLKPDYIFEPDKVTLLQHLVPNILHTSFYKFILDTHASEHGARMTAMAKATENAEEIIKELKISYNKARQESITKELSEIVGGAAALGG